jgi:hypothetical protein
MLAHDCIKQGPALPSSRLIVWANRLRDLGLYVRGIAEDRVQRPASQAPRFVLLQSCAARLLAAAEARRGAAKPMIVAHGKQFVELHGQFPSFRRIVLVPFSLHWFHGHDE